MSLDRYDNQVPYYPELDDGESYYQGPDEEYYADWHECLNDDWDDYSVSWAEDRNIKIESTFLNEDCQLELDISLYESARNGSFKDCCLQLTNGANPNWSNSSGYTALLIAAKNGFTDICLLLLVYGANWDMWLSDSLSETCYIYDEDFGYYCPEDNHFARLASRDCLKVTLAFELVRSKCWEDKRFFLYHQKSFIEQVKEIGFFKTCCMLMQLNSFLEEYEKFLASRSRYDNNITSRLLRHGNYSVPDIAEHIYQHLSQSIELTENSNISINELIYRHIGKYYAETVKSMRFSNYADALVIAKRASNFRERYLHKFGHVYDKNGRKREDRNYLFFVRTCGKVNVLSSEWEVDISNHYMEKVVAEYW